MDIECIFSYSQYNKDNTSEEGNGERQQVLFWIRLSGKSFLKILR